MLTLGPWPVDPPVVLAPMAGITNVAYRRLCRELTPPEASVLYVCEMVTSRALVERNPETLRMARFHASESPRSLQLYGVDPVTVGAAVRMVVAEDFADHVDLNFGCPVPKVTRKGGGSALPYKRRLLRHIVRAAVEAADGRIPVTVKLRKGIDDATLTYLDAGRIAQDEGATWVALHGRTAAQMYGGRADRAAMARLKASLEIPVLGNGDIWTAKDARDLMIETSCDGVVVGRGCLGRPWLFRDLAATLSGRRVPQPPTLGEVADVMRRHAELLVEAFDGDEDRACRDFRKHVSWYLKGFQVGGETRAALGMVASRSDLDALLDAVVLRIGADEPYPAQVSELPRGRSTGERRVALPEGWLGDPDEDVVPWGAELAHSGG